MKQPLHRQTPSNSIQLALQQTGQLKFDANWMHNIEFVLHDSDPETIIARLSRNGFPILRTGQSIYANSISSDAVDSCCMLVGHHARLIQPQFGRQDLPRRSPRNQGPNHVSRKPCRRVGTYAQCPSYRGRPSPSPTGQQPSRRPELLSWDITEGPTALPYQETTSRDSSPLRAPDVDAFHRTHNREWLIDDNSLGVLFHPRVQGNGRFV